MFAVYVMMMLAKRLGEFVAFFPADRDDIDDAETNEKLQRTIEAGAIVRDRAAQRSKRERSVGLCKESEHFSARSAQAQLVRAKQRFEFVHRAIIAPIATYLQ